MEIVHIDISYITLKPQAKLVYFFYHALENECSNTILQCGVYIKVETTTSPYNYLYWSSEWSWIVIRDNVLLPILLKPYLFYSMFITFGLSCNTTFWKDYFMEESSYFRRVQESVVAQ